MNRQMSSKKSNSTAFWICPCSPKILSAIKTKGFGLKWYSPEIKFRIQNMIFLEIMKNKLKIILSLALMSLLGSYAFAQSEKQIRTEVNLINGNLKKYTKKVKDVEDISLEGTQATYYNSGKGLKKISAKMYGESYNAVGEFYYQGEELIFAYLKFNRYDTQIGLDKPPKVVKVEEKRLYFTGGNLIKLLVGKKQIKSTDEIFTESKDEIIEVSGKLKAAYN